MNKAVKSTLALVASAAAMASVVASPALVSAWGDNGGGRKSYTIDQIENGALGNKIVFNSISNSVIGDEKNFVGAREYTGINAGVNNKWNANEITVENGKEYLVRLYVHNNNPGGTNAVSHNTRVAFDVPESTVSARKLQINGFIYSDNATPSEYWDYVNFVSDNVFHLEYVEGSASVENNGYASQINGGAKALSDDIVKKAASEHGVQIGYEKQDGEIPGCYTYANYVSIRVKAVFDSDYYLENKVRLIGSKDWGTTVEAKAGDKVEFQIQYKNTSKDQNHANVMIKDILPASLRYVPGTTKVYNSVNRDGISIKEDYIVTDKAINIGNYKPGANAYVRFTAEVIGDNLQEGSNTLVNWAQGSVNGRTIQDFAAVTVHVTNNGNKPEELPKTGPEAIAGGAIAAGSIVTAAGYFISSRRNLR